MSPKTRILAIDYGEKRIGLAISDPLKIFAKPLKVIPNQGFGPILKELELVIREFNIGLVVVGMPYAIEGGNTPKTEETLAFKEKLAAALQTPVICWDERYSSSEADEELIKMGCTWQESRGIKDAMAAAMILKSYLENAGEGS